MAHAVLAPRATNTLYTARGLVLMSLAIVGIACVALAFYIVDGRAARQIWGAITSR
ncbi:MAG: hypothetical protein QHC67_05425 [Sphingobium sp.]|uniref:hypothetical protein n=1 Tax=Sphingobium sp. TaxID=1912891 RepID=UPI0029A57C01|nr:hypothetical protein [Sphingobium sp.]MDX3909243.1 hypothetical protein [Sphingobium sp.]